MSNRLLPPPVFQYDPGDMAALHEKVKTWPDYANLPQLELKNVVIGPDAIFELPQVLHNLLDQSESRWVGLVMDQTPMLRDGQSLKPLVKTILTEAGYDLSVIELGGDEHGLVHPDFHQVELVKNHIHPYMAMIAVGSGVVTDITKHACFLYDQEHSTQPATPLIFCQTANSVPVYTSRMAVISKDGVKRTWPSRLSDALIVDLKTLGDSPVQYTLGGVGDTSPMFTAFADWYLGDCFGMAKYGQSSYDILEDVNALFLPYTGEIGRHSEAGMAVMARILSLAGLSMTYARESSPMSGYEHVISHMLDMSAGYFGRATANHGSQVGIASILHLIGFGWLLDELEPARLDLNQCYPSAEVMERTVKSVFYDLDQTGKMGEECWSDYRQKLQGWHQARPQFEAFLKDWDRQKQKLEQLILRAENYVAAYHAAGHPLYFEELNVPVAENQARWAYHHAHLMRKRFSHADLLFFLGWFNEDWTHRVFARMHELVDGVRARPSSG